MIFPLLRVFLVFNDHTAIPFYEKEKHPEALCRIVQNVLFLIPCIELSIAHLVMLRRKLHTHPQILGHLIFPLHL